MVRIYSGLYKKSNGAYLNYCLFSSVFRHF
nr:MAG TPA: hypothetical protein [Caudoviricetes sp.]